MHKKWLGWKLAAVIILTAVLIWEAVDIHRIYLGGDGDALPILMYHHFEEISKEGTVVSNARFREQMTALHDAGYHAVTIPQVIAFVREGTPLPDKPILITMDDGYTSNLTEAAPVLEELGMCATVFVIGVNEGETVYIHSGEPFWQERFSYEEAAPWVEKGVIDIQSHTFDMHQLADYGFSGRDGVLRKDRESGEDYRLAVLEDYRQVVERRGDRVDSELLALAYPFGYYSLEADALAKEAGYEVTITIDERINRLRTGDESCLRMMGRFNVTDSDKGEDLVDRLDVFFK